MLFGNGYLKEGKGVNKRDPNESKFKIFFELLFRKFWKLCKLNLIYIIACIPTFAVMLLLSGLISSRIVDACAEAFAQGMNLAASDYSNGELSMLLVQLDIIVRVLISLGVTVLWGMGPVTAGYTYVLRNFSREEHVWMMSDFWGKIKENFKQSIVVWIVDMLLFAIFTIAISFYLSQTGVLQYVAYVVASIILIYTTMHFYIYQWMITFNLKLKDIYRNSLILALAEVPKNLLITAIVVIIHIALPIYGLLGGWSPLGWLIFGACEIFGLIAITGFLANYWAYTSLGKYVTTAENSENTNEE